MRCIAIDDEPLALSVLEDYVQRIPYLELKGVYENPFEALQFIQEEKIDMVFIDINMPGLNGLEFVKTLRHLPQIIFTTAYSEYAVQGFELDATDYLLKPFSFQRFLRAVHKAHRIDTPSSHSPVPPQAEDYILVQSQHHMIKVPLKDIFYIEGFKEYVKIYTEPEKPILTIRSLKSLMEQLGAGMFIRIHKSFIISIDKIQSIRNGKVRIKERYLPIGDSFKGVFHEMVVEGKI